MSSFFVPPVWQPLDANGKPYANAKLYVYEAGTTDDLAVYTDSALSVAHAQPIVADSAGRFAQIFLGSDVYKFVLKTSADATIATYDNVSSLVAGDGGTLAVANGGTGSTTAATARTALGAAAQSDYTTLNSTVGDIDSELSGIGGSLGDMAAEDSVAVGNLATGMNIPIQRVFATAQPSAAMTITDGTQYLSQSFTPSRDDSTVVLRATGVASTGGSSTALDVGVFRNGVTDAIGVINFRPNVIGTFCIICEHDPGATDAITYSIRAGATLADVQLEIMEYVTTPV